MDPLGALHRAVVRRDGLFWRHRAGRRDAAAVARAALRDPARVGAVPDLAARRGLRACATRSKGRKTCRSRPFVSLWKHSSAWETMAQMFVVPPASWLLKREVLWIPIVGWAVRTYKPIAINRSAGHSAVNQVVAQGRERLAAGMGVIVYPEGTRVAAGSRLASTASAAHCWPARPGPRWCRSRTTPVISGAAAAC